MRNLKQNGFYYGALLYAFSIPFPPKIINIALIIWGVLSLFSFTKTAKVKSPFLWLLPAFYVSYFIGFFTADTISFQFMEYKLSLLIFPLIFFLNDYDEKQRNGILKVFIWSLLASGLACLVIALYNSIATENGAFFFKPNVLEGKEFMESVLYGGNYFFGRYLSVFHQTVYAAMYLCTGVAILLFRPKLFSEKLRTALLGFFVIFIFLVSNKASIIVLALILIVKLLTWEVDRSKKLIGVSLFIFAVIAVTFLNPRMKESAVNVVAGKLMIDKEARYGFLTRLLSWDAALSLIKEKPILGYGHSDVQKVLNIKYQQKDYSFPLKESYNAHNLWLQSWLENGVLAILILVSLFFFLFQKSRHRPLFLAFVILLLVNSMFEGLFNRFSGLSFFSFLVCFIFTDSKGGLPKS